MYEHENGVYGVLLAWKNEIPPHGTLKPFLMNAEALERSKTEYFHPPHQSYPKTSQMCKKKKKFKWGAERGLSGFLKEVSFSTDHHYPFYPPSPHPFLTPTTIPLFSKPLKTVESLCCCSGQLSRELIFVFRFK